MKNLYIIGARGFGREVFNLFEDCRTSYPDIVCRGFLDDKTDALDGLAGYPPIISSVEDYIPGNNDVFVCALGDVKGKRKYVEIISSKGGKFLTIKHPTAHISANTEIGIGCIICAYAQISCDITIGNFNTFQPFVAVGHDTIIGDYCHFNTYAFMGGYAKIGDNVTLHTGAVVHPHVSVGNDSIVGAGSVVIRKVPSNVTVYGNPAVKLNY